MGWEDYHNLVIQVMDPNERAWKPIWYLQIEDCKGRVLGCNSEVTFNDFFFDDDDSSWENKRDAFPTLDYPLFVGRDDDHEYNFVRHSARPDDEYDLKINFMTDTDDDCGFSSGYFHVTENSRLVPWSKLYKLCQDETNSDCIQEYYNLVQRFLMVAKLQLYATSPITTKTPREFPRECLEHVGRVTRRKHLPSSDRLELLEKHSRRMFRKAHSLCLDVLLGQKFGNLDLPQIKERILLFAPPEPLRKVRIHYANECSV